MSADCIVRHLFDTIFGKCPALDVRVHYKPEGFIKPYRFIRVFRKQVKLINFRIFLQYSVYQRRSDPLPLMLGIYEQILDENHGKPIAYDPDQPTNRSSE